MLQLLKKLTYAAFGALLMIVVAGNLPSLTSKIPKEFISAAQVFALFAFLVLAMGLLLPAVFLRERMAMLMGPDRWHDINCMLRGLSALALLAAVVAVDRILPYLADDHHGDGEPQIVMACVTIVVDRILLYCNRIGLGDGMTRLIKTFIADAVDRILLYLASVARDDGAVRLIMTFVAVALASWWLFEWRAAMLRVRKPRTMAAALAAMLVAMVLLLILVRLTMVGS